MCRGAETPVGLLVPLRSPSRRLQPVPAGWLMRFLCRRRLPRGRCDGANRFNLELESELLQAMAGRRRISADCLMGKVSAVRYRS